MGKSLWVAPDKAGSVRITENDYTRPKTRQEVFEACWGRETWKRGIVRIAPSTQRKDWFPSIQAAADALVAIMAAGNRPEIPKPSSLIPNIRDGATRKAKRYGFAWRFMTEAQATAEGLIKSPEGDPNRLVGKLKHPLCRYDPKTAKSRFYLNTLEALAGLIVERPGLAEGDLTWLTQRIVKAAVDDVEAFGYDWRFVSETKALDNGADCI